MDLDGVDADVERVADLAVSGPGGHELQQFGLAFGEWLPVFWHRRDEAGRHAPAPNRLYFRAGGPQPLRGNSHGQTETRRGRPGRAPADPYSLPDSLQTTTSGGERKRARGAPIPSIPSPRLTYIVVPFRS